VEAFEVIVSVQYKAKPSRKQRERIDELLWWCGRAYNNLLAEQYKVYQRRQSGDKSIKFLSYYDLTKVWLNLRKQVPGYKEIHSMTGNYTICKRLADAVQRFLRKEANFPKLKSPFKFRTLVYQFGNGAYLGEINGKTGKIRFSDIGTVKFRYYRPFPEGKIKTVCLTRKADGYWITFFVDVPEEKIVQPLPKTGKAVGIDVGIRNLVVAVDTEGNVKFFDNPKYLLKTEESIADLQRKIEEIKKLPESKRKRRTLRNLQRKLQRKHLKVRRQRTANHRLIASSLVKRYDTICVENLNTSHMIRNSHLSKHIADASWSFFFLWLQWKCKVTNKQFILVHPNGTSQFCAVCGRKVPKSPSETVHSCSYCGFTIHRDINAALNILKLGLGKACGAPLIRGLEPAGKLPSLGGKLLNCATTPLIEICPDEGDGEVLQNVLEGDRVIGWSVPSELDNIPFLYHFKIRCLGCYPDMPENAKLVTINWSIERVD